MVKDILCTITEAESSEYGLILQNIATLQTLYRIKRENNRLTAAVGEDIQRRMKEKEKEKQLWWEKITKEYGIPYFGDTMMEVDAQKNQIFVWRKI